MTVDDYSTREFLRQKTLALLSSRITSIFVLTMISPYNKPEMIEYLELSAGTCNLAISISYLVF